MNLERRITELRADVQSDRMSMSIGELAGLYERREIDVHPKFQRILRWSNEQKTRLIESILLRIPIPPIFVAQDENGKWDVVDGVQRLGTIFEFLGILRNDDETVRNPLCLSGTVLLPELTSLYFESEDSEAKTFSPAQRLDFRRSRLDLNIILKESTPSSKYELFERLNTGGSIASPQEVRNCVLVWMNESLFDWMVELCKDENFLVTIPLSDRLEEEQYRMELLLRFIALHDIDTTELRGIKDLSEFLNVKNRALAAQKKLNKTGLAHKFRTVFRMLNQALEGDTFRKYDSTRQRFLGPFLISAFEVVAMGMAFNVSAWEAEGKYVQTISDKVKGMWSSSEFTGNIGVGVTAGTRMEHTIPFGRKYFKP
jgi:hypothetical protein